MYGDSTDLYKCFVFKTNEALRGDFDKEWVLWSGASTHLLN